MFLQHLCLKKKKKERKRGSECSERTRPFLTTKWDPGLIGSLVRVVRRDHWGIGEQEGQRVILGQWRSSNSRSLPVSVCRSRNQNSKFAHLNDFERKRDRQKAPEPKCINTDQGTWVRYLSEAATNSWYSLSNLFFPYKYNPMCIMLWGLSQPGNNKHSHTSLRMPAYCSIPCYTSAYFSVFELPCPSNTDILCFEHYKYLVSWLSGVENAGCPEWCISSMFF